MSERIVPVKTWLRPSTYQHLERTAQEKSTTVDVLLSRLADSSVPAIPTPTRQQYTRITHTMIRNARARIADGETLSAIAADYGCSRLGLRKAITRKDNR